MYVTKISAGGGALDYSTYYGENFNDAGRGIAADGSGSAYVVGSTLSASFPTKDSMQPFRGGSYAFVSRFDPAGGLEYSTLLGGASSGRENGLAIAVDASTNAYVTGGTSSAD